MTVFTLAIAEAVRTPFLGSTGSNASNNVQWLLGAFQTDDGKLPIVIYIGHAFLLLEKLVKCVWSDEQIMGINVKLFGSVS